MNNFIETQVEKAIKDYEEKIGKYGYSMAIESIVKQVTIAGCDEIETEMKPVKPKGGTLYDVEHKSLHCVLDDLKKQCGGER